DNVIINGSVPFHVEVFDPLGATRYELYRATKLGQLQVTLPLAANDPAGKWTVRLTSLLDNEDLMTGFTYAPPARAAALAGPTHRAVYFGNDLDNCFRFARLHRNVTIVTAKAPYHAAAAERLTKILAPWGVKCQVMDVAAAGKARTLTEEEAKTWVGIGFGRVKAGDGDPPAPGGLRRPG